MPLSLLVSTLQYGRGKEQENLVGESDSVEPIVDTTAGKVSGLLREDIYQFFGIPFAAPPVGPNRFRAPKPVATFEHVRPATKPSPVAPQLESPLEQSLGAPPLEFDEATCLTLNIYSPGLDDAKRPVMVWIHGGAFVNGAGSSPIYDGTRFAQHGDVVVVTINYRLGAFGFLCLEDIFGEEFAGSGNAGLLDQIAALEWVRDNIANFGGDPNQVTIFGESAGAMSVGTLLGTPKAQGLFHRAIVQSGSASFTSSREEATETARRVLEGAGITTVAELEAAPVDAILESQKDVLARYGRAKMPFMPVVDGTVLTELPLAAIAAGKTGDVPVMVGTTADEMTLFHVFDLGVGEIDFDEVIALMRSVFGDKTEDALATYQANRPEASTSDLYTAIATDRVFRIPAIRLAEAEAKNNHPVFMYLFTWPSPAFDGALRSCHALELPFMWDALDRPGLSVITGDGPERQDIADAMHAAWIAFARTGNPGWDAYDLDRRATQQFDVERPLLLDPLGDERELWTTNAEV